MLFRKTLAAALLCALPMLPAFADDAANVDAKAPTVKWVLPWKTGTSIRYASETTVDNQLGTKPERTRSTSTNVVDITQASADGYLQNWRESDGVFQVLEGDKAQEALMSAFAAAFKDMPLEVELDAAGNYKRLRNLDAIAPILRDFMRKAIDAGAEAELARIPDAAKREETSKAAAGKVDAYVAQIASPQVLEGMLSRNISWYNAFVGIDIEPDTEYVAETELPNPFNGPAFPGKLTFSLSPSEDGEDIYVVFQQDIDREKGTIALKHAMKALFPDMPDAAMKDIALSLRDDGLFIVNRKTGIIEMFESKRTTEILGKKKVERLRMRQVDNPHEHTWREETAGDDRDDQDA